MYGTEASNEAGEGKSLGAVIYEKIVQSRSDAKKEKERQSNIEKKGGGVDERDKKNLFGKALFHNLGGNTFSGKKNFGENFNHKLPTKEKDPSKPKSKRTNKAAGLEKILKVGFGSLLTDSTAIQGGLSKLGNFLNSQSQSQNATSSGVQSIAAALNAQTQLQVDQIESFEYQAQENLLDQSKILYGGETSKAGGESDILGSIKGLWNAAQTAWNFLSGGGALARIGQMLGIGGGAAAPTAAAAGSTSAAGAASGVGAGAIAASAAAVTGVGLGASYAGQAMRSWGDTWRDLGNKEKKDVLKNPLLNAVLMVPPLTPLGIAAQTGLIPDQLLDATEDPIARYLDLQSGLGETIGAPFRAVLEFLLSGGDINKSNEIMSSADANIRENFRQVVEGGGGTKGSWGTLGLYGKEGKLAEGGAMIGEAGKEAVVDLNSADAKGNNLASDAPMKAVGGSMLAMTDTFIKALGPLGSPVSQALGPDIQNLARDFGMSNVLPNLNIGGGKFPSSKDNQKDRKNFLQDLISGSLKSLGAKPKDDKPKSPPPPPPPKKPNAGPAPKNQDNPDNGSGEPMDGKYSVPTTGTGVEHSASGLDKQEKYEVTRGPDGKLKDPNQRELPIPGYPDHFVLTNRANGDFGVWKKGFLGINNSQAATGNARDKNTGKYKDPLFRAAFNEVRANYITEAPETGVRLGYITPTEYNAKQEKINAARVNGDQENGGSVKSYEQGGKQVQKPWWDFLGLVTGSKEVQKGTTGIYSNSPIGRIGEAAAQRNKMMKELGYAKGGSQKLYGSESTNTEGIKAFSDLMQGIIFTSLSDILGEVGKVPMDSLSPAGDTKTQPKLPKASPAVSAPSATAETSDVSDGMFVFNMISAGGGAAAPVNVSNETSDINYLGSSTADGLASYLCLSTSGIG
jgi:hypothetical protein